MFNWILFGVICLLCIPGIILMSSAFVRTEYTVLNDNSPTPISTHKLWWISILNHLIIVVLSAAIGTWLVHRVELADPFLEQLTKGNGWNIDQLIQQLIAGTIGGVICAVVWLLVYYLYLRERFDRESIVVSEAVRMELGFWTRITSGGIVEEVIFRWGLLSLCVWLIQLIPAIHLSAAMWASIIITGVIFGLMHIPGYVAKGCRLTPMLYITTVGGNLWVTVFCGWLFWQYGLIAAFLVHILFHVLWYPFDIRYARHTATVNIGEDVLL